MIDRLPELRNNAGVINESPSEEEMDPNNYEEDGQQEGIDDEFVQEIKSVRQMIAALKNNNHRIQSIKSKYAKAIKSAQQKSNSQEMNQILVDNANLHTRIKDKLSIIQKKVKQSTENEPDEPETRMKKNFYINLSKQVSDVLQKQQNFEEDYKNTVKQKVTRQVRLIDRDITDDEVQEYVNNPDLAQQMMQRKIYGQASVTMKNTVCDIQDKFRDIQKLEASVNQCVALFNELSALVFAQGEKIDSIEANVVECKDYIEKGQKKLVEAKEHHKCSRKCMCIAIIAGLIIIIIVIIVVVTTTK